MFSLQYIFCKINGVFIYIQHLKFLTAAILKKKSWFWYMIKEHVLKVYTKFGFRYLIYLQNEILFVLKRQNGVQTVCCAWKARLFEVCEYSVAKFVVAVGQLLYGAVTVDCTSTGSREVETLGRDLNSLKQMNQDQVQRLTRSLRLPPSSSLCRVASQTWMFPCWSLAFLRTFLALLLG